MNLKEIENNQDDFFDTMSGTFFHNENKVKTLLNKYVKEYNGDITYIAKRLEKDLQNNGFTKTNPQRIEPGGIFFNVKGDNFIINGTLVNGGLLIYMFLLNDTALYTFLVTNNEVIEQ